MIGRQHNLLRGVIATVVSCYPLSLSGSAVPRLPPPLARAWEWQMVGHCVGHPLEVFFPEDSPRGSRRQLEQQAKSICGGCPVLDQCRAHAMNTPEAHGVWGALTSAERKQRWSAMSVSRPRSTLTRLTTSC